MFVIGATKKLQDQLSYTIEDAEQYKEVPAINQWTANLITLNRRKCLLLMNHQTGLNLTLFGLRKQQFDHLDSVIKGSLRQLLQTLEVDPEIIEKMENESNEIVYTKTSNRQIRGMMNEMKMMVEAKTEGQSFEDIDAVDINVDLNNMVFSPLKHISPINTFVKFFEESST
ncbi:hypothetical protein H0266_09330 [Halobacillus locisalis]|uniref:DUF6933 domain-containing protein n=1 Tax=Halobacillus locisalis TaxID=220753 RepID=A0A838CT96_9BACI|nr:hypothetical protein [Halobacillus locisalis]MBA2175093.1 hypothetical protein [Halobacillus locisalis]